MKGNLAMNFMKAHKLAFGESMSFLTLIFDMPYSRTLILAFSHFDILSQNVYISLIEKYNKMKGCGVE